MEERLTRPDIDIDQTAVRFMDAEVKIQDIGDKLLHLILNGPTINGVKKDILRHLVRQLYAELKLYEDMDLEPQMANERLLIFASDEANRSDKAVFVQNLGWLLRQTREQVEHCFLDEQEVVHILFRGGHEKRVNVRGNSYAAVIREVTAAL